MNFRTRAEQALKRRAIMRLGVVSSQKFHLDSFMITPRSDVERIGLYSPPLCVSCRLPVDGSDFPQHYRERQIYRISGATTDPASGLVYDEAGQFIAESSSWLPLRQLWSWPKPTIKRPKRCLNGDYVFLPKEGYFHWLMEDLAPFLAALEASPDATVLVPTGAPTYVQDFVKLLSNPIEYIDAPTLVERLVIVGKIAGQGLSPHPRDVDVVRRFFAKFLTERKPTKKLYLSRIGERRSPSNEGELRDLAVGHGFEEFRGHGMSLLEQAQQFSEAKAILGVHGAAFANLAFAARPKVCELFSAAYLPACYSLQASHCQADYTAIKYDSDEPGRISVGALNEIEQFILSTVAEPSRAAR